MDKKDRRSFTSSVNGQKGGVKTPNGKAISSQNSVSHGVFAKYGTKLDDVTFEEAYKAFAEEFGDHTLFRKTLISELAILYIRLRRCVRFENEYLEEQLNPPRVEKKLVKQGLDIDLDSLSNVYENVVIEPGKPMTLNPEKLSGLDNLYSKYEPQFLSRFCHIAEILTRSDK